MIEASARSGISRRGATIRRNLNDADIRITARLARYGISVLRVGLGAVFLWFGALKLIPNASPAEELAVRTIDVLTLGHIPHAVSLTALALWECAVGLGLVSGLFLRATLLLLVLQMAGTMTPLIFFPADTFTRPPYAPTLEGQYILKNVVLIGAGLVIGATARGGRIVCSACEPAPMR